MFGTGCCVIGSLKAVFLLVLEMFSSRVRYPRLGLVLLAFFGALFVWFAVQVEGKQFNVLDRIAVSFAPWPLYWSSREGYSVFVIAIQLALVLVLLLAAGLIHHRRLPADSKWLMT
jgi:hypothetical protein